MLRRQKQIRVQVQKLLDGSIFAVALWLAHFLRANVFKFEILGGTRDIENFGEWLCSR